MRWACSKQQRQGNLERFKDFIEARGSHGAWRGEVDQDPLAEPAPSSRSTPPERDMHHNLARD